VADQDQEGLPIPIIVSLRRAPIVARAARTLFAVPGAEVDVERLFSGGRDLLGVRRKIMGTTTMRMYQLLKSYFDTIDKEREEKAKARRVEYQAQFGAPRVTIVPITLLHSNQ